MKRYKKLFRILFLMIVVLLFFTGWANYVVIKTSDQFISDSLNTIPDTDVGLILGTSKRLSNGQRNPFFYNRIDAAVLLYNSCKIKYILVSGDNATMQYNEPIAMKRELVKNGIPDSVIYLDYAGFRTYDSVIRAKEVFGQAKLIVISQKFHNERAVYIARKLNIEAYGFNAKDVSASDGLRTKIRECFARLKVFIDFATGNDPKFLGEKIKIG